MFLDESPPPSGGPSLTPATSLAMPAPRWHRSDLIAGLFVIVGAFLLVSVGLVVVAGDEPLSEADTLAIVATIAFEVAFAGGVLLLARRRGIGWRELGFVRPVRWSPVLTAWFGSYLVLFVYQLALELLESLDIDASRFGDGNQIVLEDAPPLSAVIALGIAVVVAAPLCEELFFRALWFRGLRRFWSFLPAALLSGALFGAFHLNASVILPFTIVGMLFAWAVEESRSLWAAIAAHAGVNGVSFVATVLAGIGGVDS